MEDELVVEIKCPQCGAPGSMKESTRLFKCAYCRVNSYLVPSDIFRYVLPSRAPEGKELIYFPYWRFKGVLFMCVPNTVVSEVVDEILQAELSDLMPFNLGYKTQYLKLEAAGAHIKGRIFPPGIPFAEAVDYFKEQFETYYHSEFIGLVELIFAPFYIHDNTVYDGITNKRVDEFWEEIIELDDALLSELPPVESMKTNIKALSTLCPSCGWDMDSAPDSYLIACNNCGAFWKPRWKGFKRLGVAYLPGTGKNTVYLPFWRIRAEINGVDLDSYGDLVKIANLIKVVKADEAQAAFCFWIPAFRIGSHLFLQIAKHVTLCQPKGTLVKKLPDEPVYPVNLPMEEALRILKTVLADFIGFPEINFPKLGHIRIKPRRLALIFLSFETIGNELINHAYRVNVNRQTLEHFSQLQ